MLPAVRVQCSAAGLSGCVYRRYPVRQQGSFGCVVHVRKQSIHDAAAKQDRPSLGPTVEVQLLSTCQGVPEYWTNDAEMAQRVLDGLPAPLRGRVRVDGRFHTPAELIAAYGAADLVIATRMHAAILALVGGACDGTLTQSSAAASGETPRGVRSAPRSSGRTTGSWSSGTGTSPHAGQWTIGIGAPQ